MAESGFVSVILPTYNRLTLLGEAIASVRAQTHASWELIVVDDGSTDGTVEYLVKAQRSEPRLRPVLLAHTGNVARVRNAGLAQARGEYVAFLDSDDRWHPDKLAVQLRALRAHPTARWSCTEVELIDAGGMPLVLPPVPGRRLHSGWLLERMLKHEVALCVPAVMLERTLLSATGGFDERLRFAEDWDLWFRCAALAECLAVERPLASIRVHAGQTGRTAATPTATDMIQVLQRLKPTLASVRLRRLCRRLEGRSAFDAARYWWDRGRYRRTLAALVHSVWCDPRASAPREFLADPARRWRRKAQVVSPSR